MSGSEPDFKCPGCGQLLAAGRAHKSLNFQQLLTEKMGEGLLTENRAARKGTQADFHKKTRNDTRNAGFKTDRDIMMLLQEFFQNTKLKKKEGE